MTPVLVLVRHGEASAAEASDPGLSERGRQQAARVAERLADQRFDRLLHSPRRRARETAAVLAPATGLRPVASDWLEDRTPVPSPARRAEYPERYLDWLDRTEPAERDTDGQLLTTALQALAGLDGTVLAVTHAFVIGWFVRAALDAPDWRWLGLQPENCSLTVLTIEPDRLTLQAFNDVGHLTGL